MARGTQLSSFRDLRRGLNTADDRSALADGEASSLLNVIGNTRGSVVRRRGSHMLIDYPGVKDLSVVEDGTGASLIFSDTTGAVRAISETGAPTVLYAAAAGLSTTAPWTWIRGPSVGGNGPYYGMNGVDTPRCAYAPRVMVATAGTVPNGKYMVVAGNRLWVTGVTASPYSVYWSEIGDYGNWPVANVTKFSPDDGHVITGLAVVGNYVLVFKARSIWRIYDLDTSANVKLAENAGTLAHRTIVDSDQGCFFLDPETGVLQTDGLTIRPLSDAILPTVRSVPAATASTSAATVWKGHYYLAADVSVDGATATRMLLSYNIELGSWWLHSHAPRALVAWDRSNGHQLISAEAAGVTRLMAPGLDRDGYFQSSPQPTTDTVTPVAVPISAGTAFASRWSPRLHDFGAPHLRKRVRKLTLEGTGTISVTVPVDAPTVDPTAEGTITFDATQTSAEGSLLSLGVGREFSLKIEGVSTNDWRLDAYTFLTETRRD